MKYTREQAEEVLKDFYGVEDLSMSYTIKCFLNEKFPQLPETGLVVRKKEIAFRTGLDDGYGFNFAGNYITHEHWGFTNENDSWRPATEEDEKRWKELLIEKIKKEYPIGTTFKCLDSNLECTVTEHSMKRWNNLGNSVTRLWASTVEMKNHNNGLIFNDGKFAEKIEDPKDITKEEAQEALNKFAKWFTQNVKDKNGII